MKRRSFLRNAGALSLPALIPGVRLAATPARLAKNLLNNDSDKVLVLIQLNGGNDGLNTLIPRDQYAGLTAVRPDLYIPENKTLVLDDRVAMHPALSAIQPLYSDGRLNWIQSVGYPNQNRSHFRSTDIWQTGSAADVELQTGWFGRYLDGQFPGFPEGYPTEEVPYPIAVTVGNVVSETCQGVAANFSLTINNPFDIIPLQPSEEEAIPDTPYGDELSFLRTSILQANAYGAIVEESAEQGNNLADYPQTRLAQRLKHVARMISGGLGTKIYVVSIGGFDTHANQVTPNAPEGGAHAELLREVAGAIRAFQNDLAALGVDERVVGMTFSEFGRQIRSNESYGTDHGTAAPLLLFGNCVAHGVLGNNPQISPDTEPQEGVPMQYDFRDVYGTILEEWFELPANEVRQILYAGYNKLPLFGDCAIVDTEDPEKPVLGAVKVQPNPFGNAFRLSFETQGGPARLSVFDSVGRRVETVFDQRLAAGFHDFNVAAHRWPAGAYVLRLQLRDKVITQRIIKQ